METTKLSSQGQVTVPQSLREQWEEGQELILINIGDGVLVNWTVGSSRAG